MSRTRRLGLGTGGMARYFYDDERASSLSADPLILGHLLSEVIQDKQIERRHCPWSLTAGRDKFDRQ